MSEAKKFQRKIEDFVCEHCGQEVVGDGYTNHCPHCLWSKHVDENPGDRASECGGMMKPVGVEQRNGEWRIIHQCEKCDARRPNRLAKNDSMDAVTQISNA